MPQSTLKTRARVRRHRAPFPLTESAELFEGGEILREFEGDLAVVLWKSYKNVMLWAGALPEERGGLFAEGAGARRRDELRGAAADAEIEDALLGVAALLDAPGRAEPVAVTAACRRLSEWASERGAPATALLLMQAGALSTPLDADAACAVGRMARDRAEYARAETWFRQSIVSARETRDWPVYTRAYLGLAKVYWQRGAGPMARRCVQRAYRTATRHHLAELRGYALWDLGTLAINAGRWAETRIHIRAAADVLGFEHPATARMMNDVAYAWTLMGWYAPAVRVLRAISGLPLPASERVIFSGSLARAAGGAGEGELLDRAVCILQQLSGEAAAAAFVPGAWVDVAHGAATLGRWELAESAAERAVEMARDRGESRIRLDAEAALESIRGARTARRALAVTPAATAPDAVTEIAFELAGIGAAAGPERVLAGAP